MIEPKELKDAALVVTGGFVALYSAYGVVQYIATNFMGY